MVPSTYQRCDKIHSVSLLTPEQIVDLRKLVADREAVVRAQLRAITLQTIRQSAPDPAADRPSAAADAVAGPSEAKRPDTADSLAEELRAVEAAEGRLRDGTYGLCIACLRPVSYERLLALPTAERCLSCQEYHEWGTLDHLKTRQ